MTLQFFVQITKCFYAMNNARIHMNKKQAVKL